MDYCAWFKKIEENLEAIVKDLDVRTYLEARKHLKECKECHDLCERIVEEDIKRHGNTINYPISEN